MNNRSFVRALLSLSHPVTIGAVLLWLLNDHVLKDAWPSWWTGKLSDVAGLVVTPLLLALPLSWLLPWRMKGHEHAVAWLAFGAVGAWWALVVTFPDVHQFSLRMLSSVIGNAFYFERDPSDVIALPALYLGWYVWWRPTPQTSFLLARGALVAVVGMLSSLATSPAIPTYGISCVFQRDNTLYALASWRLYRSDDHGQSWQLLTDSERDAARRLGYTDLCSVREKQEFFSPDSPAVRYRVNQGRTIERSADGGRMWQEEFDLSKLNHEARRLVRELQARADKTYGDAARVPLGAVVQQQTGVVVLAMGLDGVVVRDSNGKWQWVAVGSYRYRDADIVSVASFLWMQIILAVVAIPLTGATVLALAGGSWRSAVGTTFMVIGWVAWGLAAAVDLRLLLSFTEPPGAPLPSMSESMLASFATLVSIPLLVVLAFVVGVVRFVREDKHIRPRFERAGASLALWMLSGAALFLLPYVLWTGMALGSGNVALVFSFLLTVANIMAGSLYLKRHLRPEVGESSGQPGGLNWGVLRRVPCPHCQSNQSWRLRAGKRRCARCHYEWTPGLSP